MKELSDRNCDKGTACARKWREGNEREINRIKYLSGVGKYLYVKSAENEVTEKAEAHSVGVGTCESSASASSSSSRMGSSNSSSSYS